MENRPQTIGIIGLGTMGLGIAQVFAQAGFATIATDAQPATRDSATARMTEALTARVAAGKLSEADCAATLSNLHIANTMTAFAACDLVIEAIIERTDAKQALLAQLEAIVSPGVILATNTSS
ncbi:MAG: 3-hydroxybutyryl-CoA dehydrogenase, partial [Acetobacteraceae bacterium]|nr:3-hydroxybutyryl-CoA dehydrogenase [Acetobacteraceae bacterium]